MKAKSLLVKAGLALVLTGLLITAFASVTPREANAASIVLSNSLLKATDPDLFDRVNPNYNPDQDQYWGYQLATSFSTGIGANTSYTLNSVTIRAFQEVANVKVQFDVYSNVPGLIGGSEVPGIRDINGDPIGGIPGASLGTLTLSGGSFGNNYTDTAYLTTAGIELAANSYYWIVATPLADSAGSLRWQASLDTAPDGNTATGFFPAYALYGYPVPIQGVPGPPVYNWYSSYGNVGEYMMKIEATANVPVPATLLLLGSGLLGLAGLRRRKKI